MAIGTHPLKRFSRSLFVKKSQCGIRSPKKWNINEVGIAIMGFGMDSAIAVPTKVCGVNNISEQFYHTEKLWLF